VDESGPYWTDPRAVAANAGGRVTMAQRELIVGRPVRGPYPAAAVLLALVAVPVLLITHGQQGWGITAATLLGMTIIWAGTMYGHLRAARRRRQANLADPVIESGIGEIRPTGNGPVLVVPDVDLRHSYGDPPLPAPGWYRVYWLRDRLSAGGYQVHRLLSAEPVPAADLGGWPLDQLAPQRDRLLAELRRTPADLADNETGALSPGQRRELRRAVRRTVVGVVVAVPFALVFVAMASVILWSTLWLGAYGHTVLALLPAAGAALFAGWIVSALSDVGAMRAALAAPAPVLRVDGPVSLLLDDGSFRVAVGAVDFGVRTPEAEAFTVSKPYTLYYLDRPRRLLCAQPSGPTDTW
jgi:hypothetical protein